MGAKGLRFRKHSLAPDWVTLPALRVNGVADTSGAGDWCSAGFIHALEQIAQDCAPQDLSYNKIYDSLRRAQAIAALSCRHVGARGLMRAAHPDAALSDAIRILEAHQYGLEDVEPSSDAAYLRTEASLRGMGPIRDLCCQTLA
jgi:fructokinase